MPFVQRWGSSDMVWVDAPSDPVTQGPTGGWTTRWGTGDMIWDPNQNATVAGTSVQGLSMAGTSVQGLSMAGTSVSAGDVAGMGSASVQEVRANTGGATIVVQQQRRIRRLERRVSYLEVTPEPVLPP